MENKEEKKTDYGFEIKCHSNFNEVEETLQRIVLLIEQLREYGLFFEKKPNTVNISIGSLFKDSPQNKDDAQQVINSLIECLNNFKG